MAGHALGAETPAIPASLHTPGARAYRVPSDTRTRRCHGCFAIGEETAIVFSTRRQADGRAVMLTVGAGSIRLDGGMSVSSARAMARALVAAADAAEVQLNGGLS